MTSSTDRIRCEACPDGQETSGIGTCRLCSKGYYASAETNRQCKQCPAGFFSNTNGSKACDPCRACPDGYHRAGCAAAVGGGTCVSCVVCGAGLVNVGCMNRAGHTDMAGTCRNRTYVVRTPLCDETASGLGLGGYTFLALFGAPQDDASFQCRRRCDNQQNKLSAAVYPDNGTYVELLAQFQRNQSLPRVFDGGHCGGPYACDVANCNIPGSSDDSQTDYQTKLACPVYIEQSMQDAFWAAVASPGSGVGSSAVLVVDAMRSSECQTCASCGRAPARADNWGRGCARDCTQLTCAPGLIFDWTEQDATAKCKTCGDLDDVRLCVSSEQRTFDGYDVSGRLPKVFMSKCSPKRELPLRGYEHSYGSCVKCSDFANACSEPGDTYYHTCEEGNTGAVATCRTCSRLHGRDPTASRFWDGNAYQHLYCQQQACPASAGMTYTGINTASLPHRICHAVCEARPCDGDAAQVRLPCVLPHQRRCKDAVNMDAAVSDKQYVAVAHTPAHGNVLEPNTTALHLFASFENILVDTDASQLFRRAQCVWNADFIVDNAMNPGGVSSRFERDCRSSTRDPRTQYPLAPLQNTVAPDADAALFSRRVLLNTSAQAVAYAAGELERATDVFAGDVYLQLNMTNANNATLAVFVPSDRNIELATWVPRWRASVHARQVAGDTTSFLLDVGQEQTCFECFSLAQYTRTTEPFATTSMTVATALFSGDKFAFEYARGLLVCEKEVQRRAFAAFLYSRYDSSLSTLFASSLTDACVSTFGVRTHNSSDTRLVFPVDILQSSDVVLVGDCVLYFFSSSRVYCLWRADGVVRELSWNTPSAATQGTLLDVAVQDSVLVRTLHNRRSVLPGENTNYVSLISSLGSSSERVLSVSGLLMFARGAPRYFLRRRTAATLQISKFETSNATFELNSSSSYVRNDVSVLFSTFVPISATNTLLEYNDDVLVFATAKFSGQQVILYVAAVDLRLVLLTTYSMPFAVFVVAADAAPTRIDDAYEKIAYAGEALLSSTWLAPRVLLLSVSVDGAASGQFKPLLLNVSDLVFVANTQHPDLLRAFEAPFVRAANAVVSRGVLQGCSECLPASALQSSSSGFFAYGASTISYHKLLQCDQENVYFEERVTQSLPIQSCAKVRAATGDAYTNVLVDITFRCATTTPLEIVLELPINSMVFFGEANTYTPLRATRLLLSAQCDNVMTLEVVTAYDSGDCATGCFRRLWIGGFVRVSGGVRIQSVRHRPRLSAASATWDRFVLLQLGLPTAAYAWTPVSRAWHEHSVTARHIEPLQRIDMSVQRNVSIERLAALKGDDSEHSVALDVLAVVPVLSEHFLPVVAADNTSWLATIVYVPSSADLRILALEAFAYGDDLADWARVHASVHLSAAPVSLRQCTYVARVVAVDAAFKSLNVSGQTTHTGCILDLARSSQCHIELPVKLGLSSNRVVGLELRAVTAGCRALSEADDVTVELAPFMRISQCPAHWFLHADTMRCTACDDGESFCTAGEYVEGCLALIHPSVVPTCLRCPQPNNSSFPNASRGCAAWQCHDGFYRANGECARCTSLLNATRVAACMLTGGRMFKACTVFENEKCVDCSAKPRYSEWTVTKTECSWRCKDGYFATAGGCELCATFAESVATLAASSVRVSGAFYRLQACSTTAQARAEACSARDFGYDLDGTYVGDGLAFGEDCALQCADNSNRHSVRINATSVWRARMCQTCAEGSWPVFANTTRLPRSAFEMSTACVSTCLFSAGYFVGSDARTCLFCPPSACPVGSFWSSRDNCTACQTCTRTLLGSVFTVAGALDDARSCGERCPDGTFWAHNQTCTPHSVLACKVGSQYAIAGTPETDAWCGACADCAFAKETASCTVTTNRQCASCGALDTWSSAWSRVGCELLCRTEQGYTKLHTAGGEVCRKCLPCPVGRVLPDKPANCTCAPCAAVIPHNALYTRGCEWTCPMYHVARTGTSGALLCEYTIRPTSNAVNSLRAVSPVACPRGQRLAQDSKAYASLVCENCSTPAGMRAQDLGATWTWDTACAWQCAWNLQKQLTLDAYRCEAVRYKHAARNATVPQTQSGAVPMALVIGLVAAFVVVAVFSLCFLGRMVG